MLEKLEQFKISTLALTSISGGYTATDDLWKWRK